MTFVASGSTALFSERWKPKKGDVVSFKHRGYLLATKKPKFPMLYRVRTDITWGDVVNNRRTQKPSTPSGTPHPHTPSQHPQQHESTNAIFLAWPWKRSQRTNRAMGCWDSIDYRRQFLKEVAEKKGIDPSDAAQWQFINRADIKSHRVIYIYCRGKVS